MGKFENAYETNYRLAKNLKPGSPRNTQYQANEKLNKKLSEPKFIVKSFDPINRYFVTIQFNEVTSYNK